LPRLAGPAPPLRGGVGRGGGGAAARGRGRRAGADEVLDAVEKLTWHTGEVLVARPRGGGPDVGQDRLQRLDAVRAARHVLLDRPQLRVVQLPQKITAQLPVVGAETGTFHK